MNDILSFIINHKDEFIIGTIVLIAFAWLYWLIWHIAKSEKTEEAQKDIK